MKVELLVNLKIGSGRIISAGSVFTDETAPIPEFILRRLKRGTAKVLAEAKSLPVAPVIEEKKPKGKRLLRKKAEPSIS
jgi:hypothetical protein